MTEPPRVLVYCDDASHAPKVADVERFHHVADGHWVADAHKGKGGPTGRRLTNYAGPTTEAFRAGHRKAVLVCPLCGFDLKRQMIAVEPILNALAEHGVSRISLRGLAASV